MEVRAIGSAIRHIAAGVVSEGTVQYGAENYVAHQE